MDATKYTQADIRKAATFMARMMPYQAQGMTFEQAAKAVLARDAELKALATAKTEEGEMIRKELAALVYNEIRK